MNTTAVTDSNIHGDQNCPGAQLARIREKKGFTREYVAVKLHLRAKVIEHLEADDYPNLPEPVFIKGYLRAYAKLLGVSPDPYLHVFNSQFHMEKKPEKALWQSRRESHMGEKVIRWVTGIVAIAAIAVVSFWWQKNKDIKPVLNGNLKDVKEAVAPGKAPQSASAEVGLSSLSKMQSMFSSDVGAGESKRG